MQSSGTWRVPIALGIVFALVLGVGIQFMPESPRWLLGQDRDEEAKRSIARVRGVKDRKQATHTFRSSALITWCSQRSSSFADVQRAKRRNRPRS